jgi:hypothetical protein
MSNVGSNENEGLYTDFEPSNFRIHLMFFVRFVKTVSVNQITKYKIIKSQLRGFSPWANYTDLVITTCRRS